MFSVIMPPPCSMQMDACAKSPVCMFTFQGLDFLPNCRHYMFFFISFERQNPQLTFLGGWVWIFHTFLYTTQPSSKSAPTALISLAPFWQPERCCCPWCWTTDPVILKLLHSRLVSLSLSLSLVSLVLKRFMLSPGTGEEAPQHR